MTADELKAVISAGAGDRSFAEGFLLGVARQMAAESRRDPDTARAIAIEGWRLAVEEHAAGDHLGAEMLGGAALLVLAQAAATDGVDLRLGGPEGGPPILQAVRGTRVVAFVPVGATWIGGVGPGPMFVAADLSDFGAIQVAELEAEDVAAWIATPAAKA